jgi:hypothetical protein
LVAKNKRDLVKTYYFNADSINNVPMVQFFTTIEQFIFYADKNIDMDYDNLLHIVEERNVRWPMEYQKYYEQGNFLKIANDLQSAIHNARIIAKRNYKYVVPQYRPTKDTLQFLMPIYLSGDYESSADFALVLDYDDNAGYYVPRNLLNLDVAYNNARLIAKPEETWLNPKKIEAISTSLEEELDEV